jgi:hypothetical protein
VAIVKEEEEKKAKGVEVEESPYVDPYIYI